MCVDCCTVDFGTARRGRARRAPPAKVARRARRLSGVWACARLRFGSQIARGAGGRAGNSSVFRLSDSVSPTVLRDFHQQHYCTQYYVLCVSSRPVLGLARRSIRTRCMLRVGASTGESRCVAPRRGTQTCTVLGRRWQASGRPATHARSHLSCCGCRLCSNSAPERRLH